MKVTSRSGLRITALCIVAISLFSSCSTSQPATSPTAAAVEPTVGAAATTAPAPPAATAAPTTAPSSVATVAPTAKAVVPTGDLKIAIPSFRDGQGQFDPAVMGATSFLIYGYAVMDPLIGLGSGGTPVPGIAERWEMSKDGKTWTFYIRKGVKFHDGSALTGADVKFSLERNWAQTSTNPDAAFMRDLVQSVDLKDDFTVVLNLKSPQGEIFKPIIGAIGSIGTIVPKKYIEEKGAAYFKDHPIGSGPFKVVKYDFNNSIDLEAVGNWRAMPQYKNVRISVVPEPASRIAMLKTGQVDVAEISTDQVPEIKTAGLQVFSFSGGDQSNFAFYYDVKNPTKSALGDVRVRKALSLAVNRQEMAEKLYGGYAKPIALVNAPPTIYFYDANQLKVDPYDPDQAKKLLAEAGYPNGFSLKANSIPWTASFPVLTQAVAGYWDKVGVKTEIVPTEYAVIRPFLQQADPRIWGTAIPYLTAGRSNFEFRVWYHSTGLHKNHANSTIDGLIAKTEASVDPAERKQLALQTAVAVKNEYTQASLLTFDSLWGVSKSIGAWKPVEGTAALGLILETITRAQ